MRKDLFDRVFCQNRKDHEPLIAEDQKSLASYVFDVAYDEVSSCAGKSDWETFDGDDTASIISFDEKIEAAMVKFDRIIKVFRESDKSKDHFLKNFDQWAKLCKSSIESLRAFAEEMQTDKFNSDIARVVGGVVGAIGGVVFGLSFLTPLAVVTVPLAIGGGVVSAVGGTVVAGTTGTEIVLVKNRLEKVKTLIEEEKERFSEMTNWFTQPEELENEISSLIDYEVIKEITPEVQKFYELSEERNVPDDELRREFKQMLRNSVGLMNKDNKLTIEYGRELAPIVMTFVIVVCLLKDHNRIVLDCAMITQRLALGLMSVMDLGVLASSLIGKLAARGAASAIAKFAVGEIFTCLGIFIDVLNVVMSSIDIHKRPETVHTKKIKEVADKFEKVFFFIEGVYNETKKYKSIAEETEMTSVIVNHTPDAAGPEDIKLAVKNYLPEEAWHKIKVKRLSTKGNNWTVKIPEIHSQMLEQQTDILIKGKKCAITQ